LELPQTHPVAALLTDAPTTQVLQALLYIYYEPGQEQVLLILE
jgi:hypothetical protein